MPDPPPEPLTLHAALESALARHADAEALRFEDGTWSYRDLDRRANAVATALVDRGLAPGDRVAMVLGTTPASVVVRLAVIKAGLVVLPVAPELGETGLEHVLGDARPTAVVHEPAVGDAVAAQVEPAGVDLRVVAADDRVAGGAAATDATGTADHPTLSELAASGDPTTPPAADVGPDDLAGHHYTGGTTGAPKGVLMTQRARTLNLYAHLFEFGIGGDDRLLLATPLAHAARLFLKAGLLAGATVVLQRRFDAGDWLAAVEAHGATVAFGVPTMLYRLLDHPDRPDRDTGSLETVVYGAAPAAPSRLREAIEAFGPVFVQLYGQTEVPNLVTTLGTREHAAAAGAGDDDRLRSAGRPCALASVRVVDPETLEPVAAGEAGEVLASAPYQFREYFQRPEATAETLVDGWVRTGDVGRLDDDGFLTLLDRTADVIQTGGMTVYSVAVEDALAAHPDVVDVAVIGVPDEEWGEAVTAVVVPVGGADLDPEGVRSAARDRLAPHEVPKRVEVVDALPRTPFGKVDKAALREPHWADEPRDVR